MTPHIASLALIVGVFWLLDSWRERRLRRDALSLALEHHARDHPTAEEVVVTAKAFEVFLARPLIHIVRTKTIQSAPPTRDPIL